MGYSKLNKIKLSFYFTLCADDIIKAQILE